MNAILKKELWTYFGSWGAWVILAAFSVVCALFLFFFENDSNILDAGAASLQSYFVLAPWLLMFVVPALAMRSIAEERQSGTLAWLFAQPLGIGEIVLGKFFAVWITGLLCTVPSLMYLLIVWVLGIPEGNIDLGATLGSYLGLVFLVGAFSAVGVFASSLAQNQIMAYLIGLFLSFALYFGTEQLASYKLTGSADYLLQNLGFYTHYLGFTRGLVDSRDLFYFVLIMMIFAAGAIYFVKRKK